RPYAVAFRRLARTAAALVLQVALREPVKARVARDARLSPAVLGAGAAEKDARTLAIAHLPHFGRHRSMAHRAARSGALEERFGRAGEVHKWETTEQPAKSMMPLRMRMR